jgi:hypothetical protein
MLTGSSLELTSYLNEDHRVRKVTRVHVQAPA